MVFCSLGTPAKAEHRGDACADAGSGACKFARRRDIAGETRRSPGQDHRLSHAVEDDRNHQTHQPKGHGEGGGILQRVEFATAPAMGGDSTADRAKQKCCCPDHRVPFAANAGFVRCQIHSARREDCRDGAPGHLPADERDMGEAEAGILPTEVLRDGPCIC